LDKKTPWKAAANGPITFFETPVSLNNSISIEDADDKSSFLINFSNLNQTGLMPNSQLKKNNFSAKFTHKFNEKLTASVFASYVTQNTIGRNSTGYNDNILSNFRQWWPVNVDIKELEQVYNASGGQNVTWNIKSPTDLTPAYWDNPYFQRNKNYESDERDRFIGYLNLDYKINNWLSAQTRISNDSYSEFQEERRTQGSVAAEFGINRLDESSGYQRFNKTYRENNYDLIFNAYKDYGKFDVRALAGGTIKRTKVATILASTQGGLLLPGIYSIQNSVGTPPPAVESDIKDGVNSYYGQLTLGYNKLAYLEGTIRRDAFAALPAGDNVLTTKSISGSVIFSELAKASWLNYGKVRIAYAESPLGSPTQSLIDTYTRVDPFGTQQLYSVNSIKNNPFLQPVKTDTKEVGLEMSVLNRRLNFDFSMYKSLTVDQIFNAPYSTSTGVNSGIVNAGSVENKGFELQVTGTPIKTQKFSWDITLNWSSNRNEVVSLVSGVDNLQLGSFQGGVTLNAQVGQPYGVIKGSDFTYLNGQRIVGANGRYVLNNNSNNVIGNINPDWIGGIKNKFTYKDFSFSFLIDMQKGGDIFSLDRSYGLATGLYAETAANNDLGNPIRNPITTGADSGGIILPGVQADGTPNTVRAPGPEYYGNSFGYRRQPNRAFIYDASYIKLREVAISYEFPKKWIGKMSLDGLKLSIVGTNLWIIEKHLPDADPESGLGSGNLSAGYSVGSLPSTRNIGCNLTFKF